MNIQGMGQQITAWQTTTPSQNQGKALEVDAATLFSKDDANVDGVLSIDETPLSEDMFSDADTDSDGSLTLEEMEQMLASTPPPRMGPPPMMGPPPGGGAPLDGGGMEGGGIESLLDALNSDEDSTTSANSTEETRLAQEIFSALDTNQDGTISAEELAQAVSGGNSSENETQTRNFNQTTAISAYQDAINSFLSEMTSGSNGDSFLEIFV